MGSFSASDRHVYGACFWFHGERRLQVEKERPDTSKGRALSEVQAWSVWVASISGEGENYRGEEAGTWIKDMLIKAGVTT